MLPELGHGHPEGKIPLQGEREKCGFGDGDAGFSRAYVAALGVDGVCGPSRTEREIHLGTHRRPSVRHEAAQIFRKNLLEHVGVEVADQDEHSVAAAREKPVEIRGGALRQVVGQAGQVLRRGMEIARTHYAVHDGLDARLLPAVHGEAQALARAVVRIRVHVYRTLAGEREKGFQQELKLARRSLARNVKVGQAHGRIEAYAVLFQHPAERGSGHAAHVAQREHVANETALTLGQAGDAGVSSVDQEAVGEHALHGGGTLVDDPHPVGEGPEFTAGDGLGDRMPEFRLRLGDIESQGVAGVLAVLVHDGAGGRGGPAGRERGLERPCRQRIRRRLVPQGHGAGGVEHGGHEVVEQLKLPLRRYVPGCEEFPDVFRVRQAGSVQEGGLASGHPLGVGRR